MYKTEISREDLLPEGLHIEYKEAANDALPKSIWETISAFANTDGGRIYLGIKEKKQKLTITGLKDVFKIKQNLIDTQRSGKISKICVLENNIKEVIIEGKSVLEIEVPKLDPKERPVYLNGNINSSFIRVGEADQKVNKEELRTFLREADSTPDSELLPNFSLDDLNLVDLNTYRARINQYTDDYSSLSNEDFLIHIGLMRKDRSVKNGDYELTKAALLLFGKYTAITSIFPSFFIDFIIKKSPKDVDYSDRIFTSDDPMSPQNIFSFFNKSWEKIDAIIPNEFKLEDAVRLDTGEKLKRVLREALVNTLVHADYLTKSPIKISAYKDYVSFKNPGDMRISTKSFMIGGSSDTRNPNIMNAFIKAKLGERTGSGGYRIFSTTNNLKLVPPEITSNISHGTELIIWNMPYIDAVLKKLPEEWRPIYKMLNEKLIIKYSDIKDLGKNRYQVTKILSEMQEKNIIVKHGERKGTTYSLSPNSPAVRMGLNNYMQLIQNTMYNN